MPNDVSTSPAHDSRGNSPISGLFLVLIVVCIALGATLSWALYERSERRELRGRYDLISTRNGMVEAQAGQLRDFLAQPGTRLIHLRGQNGAQGQSATLVWNAPRREGLVLFGAGETMVYRLMAQTPQGAVEIAQIAPAESRSTFTTATTLPAEARFELHTATGNTASPRFTEFR